MKPNKSLLSFLLACGSSLLAVTSASAQDTDGTWNANAAGNWSTTTNWSGGTVADGIGYSAFLSNVINADRIITLDTARTIGNIYAQDTTHNFTISGANTLTLDASSGQSVLGVTTSGRTLTIGTAVTANDGIEKTGAGAVSITGAITLGAAQTWTNNTAGAFTKTNASLINNDGHQLTFDGSGVFNLGTINNGTAVLTGSGSLVKNGTGRLNIGGLNSGFSGAVTANGGVMHVYNDAGAIGSGNLTLNGGVLSFYWGVNYNRSLGTGANQVQILGGESGFAGSGTTGPTINLGTSVTWGSDFFNPSKFVLGDAGTANNAVTTFSSGIVLNGGTRTIVVPKGSGTNSSTISGAITNGTGTSNLVKEGDGRLTVSANSSWTGSLTLSGGYLIFSNSSTGWGGATTVSAGLLDMGGLNLANIGGGSGRNITVASGAAVRFNALSNTALGRIVETTNEIGVMTGATGNNFDFSGSTGANLPNAFLGNWAGNGAKAEISGTITPGSDGYKFGAVGSSGNLGIRGAVTGANTLTVGQTGASGIRVTLAGAKDFTGQTVINTGAKLTLGDNLALQNSPLNVGSAGGNIAFNGGTAAATITGNTVASSPTFGGLIGSRNLRSVYTNVGGNNESNLANNAITGFTLNVGTGNTHTYSGSIGGFGTDLTTSATTGGNSTLTKTGLGAQILSGAHTYTGATTVSAGTLLINGSTSVSSAVAVNGGTLGGTGTIGGAVSVAAAATLSPGASIQSLATGALTMASGSAFVYEVADNTSTGADLLGVNGSLSLTGVSLDLTLANAALSGGGWTAGDKLTLIGYTGSAITSGFTGYDDDTDYTFGSNIWTFNYNDTLAGGNFNSETGGFTSFVTLTAVTIIPEPGSALLGALGAILLLRRRR